MFAIPGELKADIEYNAANLRVTAVVFAGNLRRRESEIKLKHPVRGEVSVKVVGNVDAETLSVTGPQGTDLLDIDPDDNVARIAPGVVFEFQPGEPRN